MKWPLLTKASLLCLAPLSTAPWLVEHSSAQASSLQAPKPPAHTQRVMAPPLETWTAAKLRPSTAQAGDTRIAKPPLKTLPAFTAVGRDNLAHDTASLSHTGHWLLLYRTEHCIPCDRLMNVLAGSGSADLRSGAPYTVIVGGPSPTAVDAVRANYGTLTEANWAGDRNHKVFTLLQLRGSPEVIAMDGDRVVWKVSGNLGDPQQVLHMTDSWIAGTAAADAAAKAKAAAQEKSATANVSTPAPTPTASATK